ncbi:MAG: sensor histidine kinase, partial [Bacteroidia bacterium]
KERTHELLEKNKELENYNQELQQVSWVLSHDLKEPLRKILTYSSIIRDHMNGNEDMLPYFNRIVDSTERMTNLINDLLDFSRLPGEIVPGEADLNKIVNDVLSDLEVSIEQSHAIISVGTLPVIRASVNHMRQLFQNLIANSLKFSKPGEPPRISIASELVASLDFESEASASGTFCRIAISDNGIGFDEKFLEKIFLVFQRLDGKATEGTGIGLAIVKKIVEKHNGIITAHSRENEGATFIIVLPLKNK